MQVFVASSSERARVGEAVCRLLERKLPRSATVEFWTKKFDFSAAYIESLEKVSREADFTVLVVAGEDVTISRKQKKAAPRDNIVFELGFFMGGLGRGRCFMLVEEGPNVKIPSDLLGVKPVTYRPGVAANSRSALNTQCGEIATQMARMGAREKSGQIAAAAQSVIRHFASRIEGAWWERVDADGVKSLSFFRIENDPLFHTVRLSAGAAYNSEGSPLARWHSVLSRIDTDRKTVYYNWEGSYLDRKMSTATFHGFGEMEFRLPERGSELSTHGRGWFWDVNEADATKTTKKTVDLRRISDRQYVEKLEHGSEKEVKILVRRTLRAWKG
jgi:hypothetical protein